MERRAVHALVNLLSMTLPLAPLRCVLRVVFAMLALAAAPFAAAQDFGTRLDAMTAAADRYLAQTPADVRRYPNELRRIAWMLFDGDSRPDALLILKQNKDDCAAASRGQRPCKALLLLGTDSGFEVATEFPLHEHALIFRKTLRGTVESMFYTSDTNADPTYRRFVPKEGHFEPDGTSAKLAQLMEMRSFVTDDRSLPLVIDQAYAAAQFDNKRARLAPFRLHIDAINTRPNNKELIADASFSERAKFLADNLAPDAVKLVEAIGWHQTLDLRIWSCDDWMVPRRFWEIEEVRLGRVGTCAEPAVFALRRGIVQSPAEFVALARYRLLQEVGVAFVLRSAPIAWELRESLKSPAQREALVFFGTATGIMLGSLLKLQPAESAPQMHSLWRKVSDQWFSVYEKEKRRYVIKSPELRAFDHDLAESEKAMLCTLRALGTNVPAVRQANCSPQTMDSITFLRTSLREAMTP